jgi:hypothetical protein
MYDDVPSRRNLLAMPAHRFPNAPPHAITRHSITERLLNAESKARLRQIVWAKKHREVGTRAAFSRSINRIKVTATH